MNSYGRRREPCYSGASLSVEPLVASLREPLPPRSGSRARGPPPPAMVRPGSSNSSSTSSFSPVRASPWISIFQPISLEAKRAFCPRFPIARDSWSWGTTTWMLPCSSGSRLHGLIMSAGIEGVGAELGRVFTPPNDIDLLAGQLFYDRADPGAFHAHASTDRVNVYVVGFRTATLVRLPASRAMALEFRWFRQRAPGTSSSKRLNGPTRGKCGRG